MKQGRKHLVMLVSAFLLVLLCMFSLVACFGGGGTGASGLFMDWARLIICCIICGLPKMEFSLSSSSLILQPLNQAFGLVIFHHF